MHPQVTLVYHTKLDDTWTAAAGKLQEELSQLRPGPSVGVIGRSKNQKLVLGRDFLIEQMPVNGRQLLYKQVSECFRAWQS